MACGNKSCFRVGNIRRSPQSLAGNTAQIAMGDRAPWQINHLEFIAYLLDLRGPEAKRYPRMSKFISKNPQKVQIKTSNWADDLKRISREYLGGKCAERTITFEQAASIGRTEATPHLGSHEAF